MKYDMNNDLEIRIVSSGTSKNVSSIRKPLMIILHKYEIRYKHYNVQYEFIIHVVIRIKHIHDKTPIKDDIIIKVD